MVMTPGWTHLSVLPFRLGQTIFAALKPWERDSPFPVQARWPISRNRYLPAKYVFAQAPCSLFIIQSLCWVLGLISDGETVRWVGIIPCLL